MFLLVPAYPGCPGSKAVKRSLLLLFSRTTVDTDIAMFVSEFRKQHITSDDAVAS